MGRYLIALKKSKNEGGSNLQNPQNPISDSFVGSVGTPDTSFELRQAANDAATSIDNVGYCHGALHRCNCDPLEGDCVPLATKPDILERLTDAVTAEPVAPIIRQASHSLNAKEETAIRIWMTHIGETDLTIIAEKIAQCQMDEDARRYFIEMAAAELPKPAPFPDDRRTCNQCANLIARRCQAAKRSEIVASRNYEPIRDLPRRCEGYAPGATDTDRRPGRERWQGLTDTKGTK
jgi:hypothetical protein